MFFPLTTVGTLVDTWACFTLYPGGIPRLMTGTSPPSCILLENRLYISKIFLGIFCAKNVSFILRSYLLVLSILLNRSCEDIFHHYYFWRLLGAKSKVAKKVAKMKKSPDVNFGRNLQEKVANFAINCQIWQHWLWVIPILNKSDFWIPTLYLRKTGILMHSSPDVENFTSRAHESCDTDLPEATLTSRGDISQIYSKNRCRD